MLNTHGFSELTVWNRAITAYSPDRGFEVLEDLTPDQTEALKSGSIPTSLRESSLPWTPQDTHSRHTLETLQELDEAYNGWVPGALTSEPDRLNRLQAAQSRRPLSFSPLHERPTLPSSLLRTTQIIESTSPVRIYLDSDVGGLSLILSDAAEVWVGPTDLGSDTWLKDELQRTPATNPLHLNVDATTLSDCDCAVITASHSVHTLEALERALAVTRPGAEIIVQVRDPWDGALARILKNNPWPLEGYHRDVQHWLLPGGIVADGGGDIAIFKRPAASPFLSEHPAATDAEIKRSQPYFTLDIDGLLPERLTGQALSELAENLSQISPHPEAFRHHHAEGERLILRWGDVEGNGLILECRRHTGHMLLTFLPYDPSLEWATLVLILQALGTPATRVRPTRPHWWGTETLFA